MTKHLSIIFLSGVALLGCFAGSMQAQLRGQNAEEVYNRGIAKTRREDYRGAIADFQQAATLFNQSGNLSNAYKSQALATYWQYIADRLAPAPPPNTDLAPKWYVGGACLPNTDCKYSVTFVNPGAERTNFGGVVILQENLRMLNRPDGTGEPINAVLDAQTVPKLRQGEYFSQIGCQMRGRRTQNVFVAIAQTRGYQNDDFYPARLAWRINLTTKKIESIPATNIRCENPCPGGC